MTSSHERSIYENAAAWKLDRFTEIEEQRLRATIERIPLDSCEILDLGCGNGFITHQLRSRWPVLGLDRSFEAMRYLSPPICQGDAVNLPFCSAAFDTVLTTEVIEHIPHMLYHQVLAEIVRVARRYILISVPYHEDLRYFQVKCPACKCIFNPSYHMRSFSTESMKYLFSSFPEVSLISVNPIVSARRFLINHVGRNILMRIIPGSRKMENLFVCPQCGYRRMEITSQINDTRNLNKELKRGFGALLQRLPFLTIKRYMWLLAVYQKTS